MINKEKFFEHSDFTRLANAKKEKNYVTIIEICDKFLSTEGIDDINGAKEAFEHIKNASLEENEQKLSDSFFELVKCSDETTNTMSAQEFISNCTLAIKMGNITKAKELSKEYADITKEAMYTSGKPKLSDDFLFNLAKATINNNRKQLNKLLKKIR